MPLAWEELGPEIGPAHFTVSNGPARVANTPDLGPTSAPRRHLCRPAKADGLREFQLLPLLFLLSGATLRFRASMMETTLPSVGPRRSGSAALSARGFLPATIFFICSCTVSSTKRSLQASVCSSISSVTSFVSFASAFAALGK